MNFPKILRISTSLAIFTVAIPLHSASISGGDETIETVPTPKPGFTKSEDSNGENVILPAVKESALVPNETKENSASGEGQTHSEKPAQNFLLFLKEAQKSYKEKNFDDALEFVRKAEALKPNQAEIINFRGAIYAETGRYSEAIDLYNKTLEINPKSFWAIYNIAEVDFIQKRYSNARAKFQAALEKFPDNELIRFKIILTYLMEKKNPEAKAELDKFPFPAKTSAREFSYAAWEYAHNNPNEGQGWVNSGIKIYGYNRTNFVYDCLADLGWLPKPRPEPVRILPR